MGDFRLSDRWGSSDFIGGDLQRLRPSSTPKGNPSVRERMGAPLRWLVRLLRARRSVSAVAGLFLI
ncbi:MAG TPA: hypothetical protein VIV60_15910, partial [Polyangiaceae bacterium]